ncbi:lipopolysaccharide biosynthesis regulator YciM [Bacteroides zoogleoformans]|nr:lipopolysaccharide biosynthesis regulator YciM [Bacteroides zoogleoformans]
MRRMKYIRQVTFFLLFSLTCSSCGALVGGVVGGTVAALIPVVTANGAVKKDKKKLKKQDAHPTPQLTDEEQRRYDYFFLEAARLKVRKEYAAAFDLLQHCLTIAPDDPSALYEIAQYYLFLKQVTLAQAALEKAVENAPDNYWYSQALVGIYMQQNETDQATELLEKMATRFSDRMDPLYSLLEIYNKAETYDKVIGILNKLEKKIGKSEQLSMEKFRIYLQQKDDKRAFHEIESLVEEYPSDMRYQVVLGDAYMQNGKSDKAYDIYKKVLTEEPDNVMAMYSLASYYDQTGQKELYEQQLDTLLLNRKVASDVKVNVMRRFIVQNEQEGRDSTRVLTLFDRIMEQDPDDTGLPMLYAQYLLSKKMNEQTWPVLRQVLVIDPTNTAARMMLVGEAVRKEDNKDLMALCEAGVESNPDMLEFYYYLVISYNQAERLDDALNVCLKALTHVTDESNKEMVSNFYAIMGDIYHTKSRNLDAYAAYDSSLVYNPSNIDTLNNYAYYLSLERRDLDKAEEMSYKTVKADPNNPTYLDTYAWILFVKGNYAEARLYIDEAVKNDTEKSNVVVEHCGDIYYMTGDAEGAMNFWKQAWDGGNRSDTLKQKIQKKKYIVDENKPAQ